MCTLQKAIVVLVVAVFAFSYTVLGASLKIIGGEEAAEAEFPFLVAIQYKGRNGQSNQHSCGGTLINMTRVITAAHCVEKLRKEDLIVVAGTHLLRDAIRGILQSRDISNIVIHRDYEQGPIIANDIAVVDLYTPFEGERRISSIRMASRGQTSSGQCLIAGWGATTDSTFSENLMKGTVTINSQEQCTAAFPGLFDPDRQICAGGLNGERVNICTGDTGGGIYCNDGEGLYFAGIASWGSSCEPTTPGVYMDIGRYRSFIDSVIYEIPQVTTTPISTSTNSQLEGVEENNGDNSDNNSKPENHKPIVPCRVRK